MIKKPRRGRLPDTKLDNLVKSYKKKGLSFSEIGKIMGVSKQMAYFRYLRVNSYPQDRLAARK